MKEHAKVLKRLGFPALESAATPASTLPKMQTCMVRRMEKLEECSSQLKNYVKKQKDKDPEKPTQTMERRLS